MRFYGAILWAWVWATCLPSDIGLSRATADDRNPFHLPLPRDGARPGAVLLHGGGELSDAVLEKFIELAGGPRARIVLIPSGTYVRGVKGIGGEEFPETEAEFVARLTRRYSSWIELAKQGRIADFQFLYTDNQTDRDDPKFLEPLARATGVWIPGMFQGKLAWRFAPKYALGSAAKSPTDGDEAAAKQIERTSLFQTALGDVVARGGVVGGLGGGMSALAEIMIMGDTGEDGNPARPVLRYGLGLLQGAILEQHFEELRGRLERFTGLLRDTPTLNERCSWPVTGRSMIGLAVDSETALLVRGDTVAAIGKRRGHIFVKSNGDRTVTWRMLAEADGPCELVPASRLRPTGDARQTFANPFGMPVPHPGARPGIVVLHGGRYHPSMIETFPKLAAAAKPNFVHCPAASSKWRPQPGESPAALRKRLEEDLYEWPTMQREGKIGTLDFLTTVRREDANDPRFVAPLKKADAVWFSGGDQSVLAELFVDAKRPTLFQRELFDVLRRGGIVGGTSAGTAIMAKIMTVDETSHGLAPPQAEIAHGFGLLSNVVLEQHFLGEGRGGRIERFSGLLLDNRRLRAFLGDDSTKPEEMLGLVIEEKTAFLLQENRLKVFGDNHAHVFLKSRDQKTVTWHKLEPGDAAFIAADAAGPRLELDDYQVR